MSEQKTEEKTTTKLDKVKAFVDNQDNLLKIGIVLVILTLITLPLRSCGSEEEVPVCDEHKAQHKAQQEAPAPTVHSQVKGAFGYNFGDVYTGRVERDSSRNSNADYDYYNVVKTKMKSVEGLVKLKLYMTPTSNHIYKIHASTDNHIRSYNIEQRGVIFDKLSSIITSKYGTGRYYGTGTLFKTVGDVDIRIGAMFSDVNITYECNSVESLVAVESKVIRDHNTATELKSEHIDKF